ncbi:MAG: S41 family peptidase [Bacteroidales bacterium]|nr:S41 family peptidase [Bacteroidales bacterium]
MKTKKNCFSFYFIPIIIALLSITSCTKEDPIPVPGSTLILDINTFIWEGLNYNYLWYKDLYNLSDNRFTGDAERDAYLINFNDPEALFYYLLNDYPNVDEFSWITEDYVELNKYFQGITTSMGYKYILIPHAGIGLVGSVLYVVDGSPADKAGIKRGDIFSQVNGTDITSSNYGYLLYNVDSYTLTISELVSYMPKPLRTVHLSAEEVVENPVHYSNIYNIGDKKVGYLFYKGFRNNYEVELNNVFGYFASEGIDELVLDLRYNGGGYVSTCARLGSMIYQADTNKIFCIKEYNDKLGQWLIDEYGPDAQNFNFYYSLYQEDNSIIPINSLGLDHIYVLATGSSASASELLINCLRAYIDVTIIGSKTYGKNVGSITVYDEDDEGNINPDHLWAMQPIISMSYDVNHQSPYANGFQADYSVYEDYLNIIPFGDENETMLKYALDLISGNPPKGLLLNKPVFDIVFDSEEEYQFRNVMITDLERK